MAFATADVQAAQPFHLRQHRKKGRRVDIVAIHIMARPRELGPHLSILIPHPPNFTMVHARDSSAVNAREQL